MYRTQGKVEFVSFAVRSSGEVMQKAYQPGRDLEMKTRIFQTLREMICGEGAMPLDKVTVKALCAEAGITTRTFYNHFTDKYAVVAWFMELSGAGSFAQIGLTATPQEALSSYVYTLSRYSDFLAACSESKHYGSIYSYLLDLSRQGLEYAAEQHLDDKTLPKAIQLQARYFAIAAEAVVSDWASGRIDATEDEVADLICSMIPHELYKLIEEPLYGKGSIPWLDATKMQTAGFGQERSDDLGTIRTRPDGTRVKLG